MLSVSIYKFKINTFYAYFIDRFAHLNLSLYCLIVRVHLRACDHEVVSTNLF